MNNGTSNEVKTAVVPVGGYGTRFLPASKSIPKEMFPLFDRPVVYYVVEELVKSGIENIIFVVGHRKQSIEDFFSIDETFENFLTDHGKEREVRELQRIATMASYSFVYTSPPYGNGAALHAVRHALQKNEPFVLTWGDEFILSETSPRIRQCIETFVEHQRPVISAIEISDEESRCKYGMARVSPLEGSSSVMNLHEIVEKPERGTEPSVYASHGAYVLPYSVYDVLDSVSPGKNGELWLTDILNAMAVKEPLLIRIIEDGTYFDCGSPLGLLHSQVALALRSDIYGKEFRAFLGAQLHA